MDFQKNLIKNKTWKTWNVNPYSIVRNNNNGTQMFQLKINHKRN